MTTFDHAGPPSASESAAAPTHDDRLRQVIGAGVELNEQLDLDDLLEQIVEVAAALTDARYCALGVLDRTGTTIERFITTGIDRETRARLGEPPIGRGILGALIRDARPLRLRNLHDDPRSAGFPPGHPPMSTFLGVPILLRGHAFGNLYMTEKAEGREFSDEDEELAVLLAAQAAVAIENARLYESMAHWMRQLEALSEIGNVLLEDVELDHVLALIARRLRELAGARLVTILLPEHGGDLVVAAADGDLAGEALGMRSGVETSKAGKVLGRRRGQRIDAVMDDPEFDRTNIRRLQTTAAIFQPLVARDEAIGVLAIHDRLGADPRFSDADYRLTEAFASRAALAIDLSRRISRDTVRHIVEGQESERRRLARELHDETGQALTSILLGLRPLEEAAGAEAVGPIRELVQDALRDVRRIAVELRPASLDDFGLVAALERIAESIRDEANVLVDLRVDGVAEDERLPAEVETAIFRIVQEALTNVKRHARARRVRIELERDADVVRAAIEDDGDGFVPDATRQGSLGLVGIRERAALLGGTARVESRPRGGTRVVVELPWRGP